MDPVTAICTSDEPTPLGHRRRRDVGTPAGRPRPDAEQGPHRVVGAGPLGVRQLKLSPQAHELPALGLSMVKPCFSMVSAKSIVAPSR